MKHIRRIKALEYRHGGIVESYKTKFKSIEIDGDVYINEKRIKEVVDLDEQFTKEKWFKQVFTDLSSYGITITTYDNVRFDFYDDPLERPYLLAYEYGDIPKNKIKYIHYGKIDYEQLTLIDRGNIYIKNSIVEFPIFGYGWNNTVNISMPLGYFITVPFHKHNSFAQDYIEDTLKHIFPKRYFTKELSEKETISLLIDCLSKKIKLKKNGIIITQKF